MNRNGLFIALGLSLTIGLLFGIFPELDLKLAALFFDPSRSDELAQKILQLVNDEKMQRALSVAGQARAAEFSWRSTAEQTLEVYRTVLRRKGQDF